MCTNININIRIYRAAGNLKIKYNDPENVILSFFDDVQDDKQTKYFSG